MSKSRFAVASIVIAAGLTGATPAVAGGCNGVVDIFRWGCAPWDNNNGPNYPYYRAPRVSVPQAQAKVETIRGVQYVTDLRNGVRMPLVGAGAGNIVGAGAGN